jgi:hypothetical protein
MPDGCPVAALPCRCALNDVWIDCDAPEIKTAGVRRLLRIQPRDLRLLPRALPFCAAVLDYSAHLEDVASTTPR